MWVSDKWRDYELLDCSEGERLERWGIYTLVRPDPQVIWRTPKKHRGWREADARYTRSADGGGRWSEHSLPESWEISYGALRFAVRPMNFKHTGLFPEQAANWEFIAGRVREAGRPVSALNLFAYSGGATAAAAAAGASVCHVDAAKGMVRQARENAALSGLAEAPVRWIIDDCASFVEREIRRGRAYDAVIMDPPSYGRGPSGEVWKLEDGLWELMSLCVRVMSDRPCFFLISSYTAGLNPSVLEYMLGETVGARFGGRCETDELGLPVSASGRALPCGASGRWIP